MDTSIPGIVTKPASDPGIGRIVIYHGVAYRPPPNGILEHPAIVTRALGDGRLNLHVFFDSYYSAPVTDVPPLADDGAAGWRWPERTT